MAIDLSALVQELLQGFRAGQTERQTDKTQGLDALTQALSLFDADYGKAAERTELAQFNQSLASRGLSGSTRGAAVSAGRKQQTRETRKKGQMAGLQSIAQFLANFNTNRPSAGDVSYAATGGFGGLLSERQQTLAEKAYRDANPVGGGSAGLPIRGGGGGGVRVDYGGGVAGSSPFGRLGGGGGGGGSSGSAGRGANPYSGDSGGDGGAWGGLNTFEMTQSNTAPQTIAGMFATQDYEDLSFGDDALDSRSDIYESSGSTFA